jgi:hypothetical protein
MACGSLSVKKACNGDFERTVSQLPDRYAMIATRLMTGSCRYQLMVEPGGARCEPDEQS